MAQRKILLVEPAYPSKYPPLGLMKIAAYHRKLGDTVVFKRGCCHQASCDFWDRIYVTSLFSYDWKITVETVRYYKENLFGSLGKIFAGGIAASIMPDRFYSDTGIYPIAGCLNRPGMLDGGNDLVIDQLPPDYSILAQIDYQYAYSDAYLGYATRGCVRKCHFCAVPSLEPQYVEYLDIKPWIEAVRRAHGEKKDLLLMDNNVLASPKLSQIVSDIKAVGFSKGEKLNGKSRHVDFNQGMDARLLTEQKMDLLADLPIVPFRLAYDTNSYGKVYERAVRLAAERGVRSFSTYILFNFHDKPTDLWDRMHHNVELGEKLGVRSSSFPMKYIPVTSHDRRHIGPHWNRRYLRSIQCVSLVTGGVISARHDFFHKAFGNNHREFLEILAMPEPYIINRAVHEARGAAKWRTLFRELTPPQRRQLLQDISLASREEIRARAAGASPKAARDILGHYTLRQ